LKPGGWVEIQEYETWIQSDDDTAEKAISMQEWQTKVNEAASTFGKPLLVAGDHKQNMIDAGFVNVVDVLHKVFPKQESIFRADQM
jgi:hypothetical protein